MDDLVAKGQDLGKGRGGLRRRFFQTGKKSKNGCGYREMVLTYTPSCVILRRVDFLGKK